MAKKVELEKLYKQAQVLANSLGRFERLLPKEAQDLKLDIKDLIDDLHCAPQTVHWPPPGPVKRPRRPQARKKGGKRA